MQRTPQELEQMRQAEEARDYRRLIELGSAAHGKARALTLFLRDGVDARARKAEMGEWRLSTIEDLAQDLGRLCSSLVAIERELAGKEGT